MANPIPNETELYERIKREQIHIHPLIWDVMYHYLGDYISVINLIASFYIEQNVPMPLRDARMILAFTHRIKDVVDKILHPTTILEEDGQLDKIKGKNISLHPIIKEFFTHYISNDTYGINLCVSFYLDPLDEQPILVEDVKKILEYTSSMREFLERLREVTSPD